MMNVLDGYTLTAKETEACLELISKMREEEAHKKLVEKYTNIIRYSISKSIAFVGLDETKRIVRQLNRELRAIKEES